MIGRRTLAGLSLLCALAFCAFAAQSASAVQAVNTTAFTCKEGETKDFADEHCDEKVAAGTGKFGHVKIPLAETTPIVVTNEKTANKTTESSSLLLKGKAFGAAVEITCKKFTGEGQIHNIEDPEFKHTVTGIVSGKFTECEVKKPAKCTLKEAVLAESNFTGVEGLGSEKNTMGVEFNPKEGKTFATLTLEGAECALKGTAFKVEGSAIATGTPSPSAKHSGATSVYEPGNEMESLSIGGVASEFTGTFTTKMAPKAGEPQPAIALTTVT